MHDPGHIPNMIFLSFGLRHQARLFFPGLKCEGNSSNEVSNELKAILYKDAVRPTAIRVLPHLVRDWPASFSSAQFKDHGPSGVSNTTLFIPQEYLQQFDTSLRSRVDCVDSLKWARNFVWGTEIRGIKDITSHSLNGTPESRKMLLESVLTDLPEGTWYVDVGIEYSIQGRSLQWCTDSHHTLIQHITKMTAEQTRSATRNNRAFSQQLSSHLNAIAGFRLSLAARSTCGPFEAAFVQAYTTDKSQTYHPHYKNYGKAITPKQALTGNPPKFCESLISVYNDASTTVDVSVRVEMRVPYIHAPNVLVGDDLDWNVIRGCISSFKREVWW